LWYNKCVDLLTVSVTARESAGEPYTLVEIAGEADGGRFSARITGITTTVEPSLERVTIGLAVPSDSAPPHALAHRRTSRRR